MGNIKNKEINGAEAKKNIATLKLKAPIFKKLNLVLIFKEFKKLIFSLR